MTNAERQVEKRRMTRRRGNVIGVITFPAETRSFKCVTI